MPDGCSGMGHGVGWCKVVVCGVLILVVKEEDVSRTCDSWTRDVCERVFGQFE